MPRHPKKTLLNRLFGRGLSTSLKDMAGHVGAVAGYFLAPAVKRFHAAYANEKKRHGGGSLAAVISAYDRAVICHGAMNRVALLGALFGGLGICLAVGQAGAVHAAVVALSAAFAPPVMFFATPALLLAAGTAVMTAASVVGVPAALLLKRLRPSAERRRVIDGRRAVRRLEKSTRFRVKKLPYNNATRPAKPRVPENSAGGPHAPTP